MLVDWSRSVGPGQQEELGRGRANGDLLMLSRELKYSLHSASRFVLLVGGVPSLFVDLDTGFLAFTRQLTDDFLCGGVFALGVCNLEVFHLFVYSAWLLRLMCRTHSDWNWASAIFLSTALTWRPGTFFWLHLSPSSAG